MCQQQNSGAERSKKGQASPVQDVQPDPGEQGPGEDADLGTYVGVLPHRLQQCGQAQHQHSETHAVRPQECHRPLIDQGQAV